MSGDHHCPTIYHGTPITPRAALDAVSGRSFCVSYYRRDCVKQAEDVGTSIMYDNGAYSFWQQARKAGKEWADDRDWGPYYSWLEGRLGAGLPRWGVVPDAPGAPSQLNDALLNEWPFSKDVGAPLWHMDGPLSRLGTLCETWPRVCLGWVGETAKEFRVGCDAFHARMEDVARFLGNEWPQLHMMRGTLVAHTYPFFSADSSSLGQNHHRYHRDNEASLPDAYAPVAAYADRLENMTEKKRTRDESLSVRPDQWLLRRRSERLALSSEGQPGSGQLHRPHETRLSRRRGSSLRGNRRAG